MIPRIFSCSLALLLATAVDAGKLNLETGESCFGLDCVDFDESQGSQSSAGTQSKNDPELGGYSAGVYRIPYEDGTDVKINHGYFEHNGPGKLDMHGKGTGTHRVVAAADGQIMHIQDRRSKQQNPKSAFRKGPCLNNFVWIRHDNGEWSKYSHLSTGSTTGAAGLSEGQRVSEGTYLGDEDAIGCAWPKHLHFEIVKPPSRFDTYDPRFDDAAAFFDLNHGGLIGTGIAHSRNPKICGIEGLTLQDKESYTAVAGPGQVKSGRDEEIRHGMPLHNYRCFLERGILTGYRPVWIDFFNVGKEIKVNVVLRPRDIGWASRTGLTEAQLVAENEVLKAQGYRLRHIDSYEQDGAKYLGIWENRGTPAQRFYVGQSAAAHQTEVDRNLGDGYRPVAVSVVDDRDLKYSAIWEQVSSGWALRSNIGIDEYRSVSQTYSDEGKQVVFVSAFEDEGAPRLSAIWYSGESNKTRRRTDLGKSDFSDEWDLAEALGLTVKALTAHDNDGVGRYTTVFAP